LEPYFADWVRESFKPLGVYINFWQPELKAASKRAYAVMLVNDEARPLPVKLTLEFEGGAARELEFEMPALGAHTWQIALDAPATAGGHVLKATARVAGREATVSRRLVEVTQ